MIYDTNFEAGSRKQEMARVAVTYEQVAAVANALYAQGITGPGTKAIREELAKRAGPGAPTGSPNTIQRHLDQWRLKVRPVDQADPPQLPVQLAGDILRALNAAASIAREKVEERLSQVQTELDELAAAGESSDARIDELTRDLVARTSERDSMAGQLAERTSEAVELKAAVAFTQDKLVTMDRELHTARSKVQAANGRVDEMRQATERQLSKMQGELNQVRTGHTDAERRVSDAEKRCVGAEARLEGERAAKAAIESNLAELQVTVKRLEPQSSRASGAEAAASGLRDQLTLLSETVSMLRGMLQAAGKDVPTVPAVADGSVSRQ